MENCSIEIEENFPDLLFPICLINLSFHATLTSEMKLKTSLEMFIGEMKSERFSKLNLWRFAISLFTQGRSRKEKGNSI